MLGVRDRVLYRVNHVPISPPQAGGHPGAAQGPEWIAGQPTPFAWEVAFR